MRPLTALALLLPTLAAPAAAQRLNDPDEPANHPVNCPYTGGDLEMLARIGVVGVGDMPFGTVDSAALNDFLLTGDVRWVETDHFRLGFGLGPYKVTQDEKKALRAELRRVAENWDEVDPKMRVIDPWMRTYLFALRLEDLYTEFQELLGVTDEDFPAPGQAWDTKGKFMGSGPYLGQGDKYEVLILTSGNATKDYLRHHFGLRHDRTQRWNILELDKLHTVIPAERHLRVDRALHGHVVFNVVQTLLIGYRHYSYDLPVWLREGVAHWFERRVSPEYNSFDSSEGAVAEMTRKDNWQAETRKLVVREEAPSLARLMAIRDFAGLELEHHFTTWSMVDYLQREHPGFLAVLIDRLSGLLNEQNVPDGSELTEVHRDVFREELSMSYAAFDRAWREWVLASYSAR